MNEAKRLAQAIGGRLAVDLRGPDRGVSAYRWKTDVEENAKRLATAGHSGDEPQRDRSVGRAGRRGLHVVFLRDAGEPPEIERRFAVLRELIAAAREVQRDRTRGQGRAARLLALALPRAWDELLPGAPPGPTLDGAACSTS